MPRPVAGNAEQVHADRHKKVENVTGLHVVEQNWLAVECRCDYELSLKVALDSGVMRVGRVLREALHVGDLELIAVGDSVSQVIDHLELRRVVEILRLRQRVTHG